MTAELRSRQGINATMQEVQESYKLHRYNVPNVKRRIQSEDESDKRENSVRCILLGAP